MIGARLLIGGKKEWTVRNIDSFIGVTFISSVLVMKDSSCLVPG